MATETLDQIKQLQQKTIADEYGGKQSNQFVTELKSSTMFQFNWGELLSAAPTALSLMGSCWVAAANPVADAITMKAAVPTGGFKYIVNRSDPTLRSILVDVCNNGGRESFKIASRNMAALQVRSKDVCDQRIPMLFSRLGVVTQGPDQLQNFNDALDDFQTDARQAAELATKTREAFSLWGKMVGELHAATEQKQGQTSVERNDARSQEIVANIEKTFAVDAQAAAKAGMEHANDQLKKAEKRLDSAMEKVPGPWENVLQSAVSGFTQALPSIVSGVLPMVIAGSNPIAALAMGAAGPGKTVNAPNGAAPNGTTTNVDSTTVKDVAAANTAAQKASDPAFVAADELRGLVNLFYENLGGDAGTIDWKKFENPSDTTTNTTSGCAYLQATFKGRKGQIDVTGTDDNKKLLKAIDDLVAVVLDIQTTSSAQTDMGALKVPDTKISEWKTKVKTANLEILRLASSAPNQGGKNVPNAFGNIKIPPPDLSAQTAQVNSAMQGVQIAQNAVDLAQSSYEAAVKKQAETAKAMAEVETRLKSLQEKGKTLDEIKNVLKDCIAVLVDLVIQIGKIEKFFTMLTTIVDEIVIPTATRFKRDLSRVGERTARDKYINVDDVTKQTIYGSTLQLRAYFSLLADIAAMYTQVDKQYIGPGMDLCTQLSAGSASKVSMESLSGKLAQYSMESAQAVADLVNQRQSQILAELKDRAQKIASTSQAIENTVRESPVAVDPDANKAAVAAGGEAAKAQTEALVKGTTSATAVSNEDPDFFSNL